jgi:hypothetical protein
MIGKLLGVHYTRQWFLLYILRLLPFLRFLQAIPAVPEVPAIPEVPEIPGVPTIPDNGLQVPILKDRNILVSIWQDSNKVGFCTTVHNGTEWAMRNRKRPKVTSTFAAITKQPFYMFNPPIGCKEPYEHTRLLPIPGAIDDYNHHMGAVDIADQLLDSQLSSMR